MAVAAPALTPPRRPLAVVTGASSGIGWQLAREAAERRFDLVVAAEDAGIDTVAEALRVAGARTEAVRVDLTTATDVDHLAERVHAAGRPVTALMINAGVAVAGPFTGTDLEAHLGLVALNVAGAVRLAHRLLPAMLAEGRGHVMFTSSIAATVPGPYMTTYNASKAFLYSLARGLRRELRGSGVSVTVLMPGPTDTPIWDRAGMGETWLGRAPKDDPAVVARSGFEAMLAGTARVVPGKLRNRVEVVAAAILPDRLTTAVHAVVSRPRSGSSVARSR